MSAVELPPSPSSPSFFPSQQQLQPGAFTNSGPFSRQPNVQQFILNGQQTQFQPVRNAGSLSFSDAVSAVSQPSFFQQTPIQRPQQHQQQQQQFNFFPSSSQQQRFRPTVQQQRTEQQDSIESFDEHQNSQSSLISQQSSQERFNGDLSRRPLSPTNGIVPGTRVPSSVGSIRWWNPETTDAESVSANTDDESSSAKDDTLNQQRQSQQQKRGRGQLQQRRPINTPVPPSLSKLEQQQEQAAIGFTVIHDENDDRSWSQPIITTHRPQSGPNAFRNRNPSTSVPSTTVNRRPTTYNPLSVIASSSTSVKSPIIFDKQQPTTIRSRKPPVFSTTTTTESSFEDDEEQEEQLPVEEKRQILPRRPTVTTLSTPIPITTLRTSLRPKLNTPAASAPQQLRMKKVVNSPAVVQSITTRKPILTSTTTLAPTTTTNTPQPEEYEDYEDIEYTTMDYVTTELPHNKKQSKLPLITQSITTPINQKKSNSLIPTTESWVVVASVQTSRSVSSSSSGNKNVTAKEATIATTPTNKHRFNNKPTTTTTSTTTVESIIDKLDRVQSELSNGILYGSSSTNTNNSHILTDIQSGGNNDDKRNDVIISSFTTSEIKKTSQTTSSTTIPTTIPSSTTSTSTTTIATSTTEKEDETEDEDKEEYDDSSKETTFVRKFTPSKQRTTTVASVSTTSTVKSSTPNEKKKSLIDTVKFDELLTSGLLPAGFNPKSVPAYKSKTITTTTTTERPTSVTSSTNINISSTTIPTTTITVKTKLSGLNIKFVDDSSALASLLPPGFKLDDIKPMENLSPSLLPPGYKPSAEDVVNTNTNKTQETISTMVILTTEVPISSTTIITSSTTGIVFPNSSKGINGTSGTRKPLPSSKKMQGSVTVAPVIQKGWPIR